MNSKTTGNLEKAVSYHRRMNFVAVAVVIAIVTAILLPGTEWASSGDIPMAIRVRVIDADTLVPIPNATVTLFRGPHSSAKVNLAALTTTASELKSNGKSDMPPSQTNSDGVCNIDAVIRTGASHSHPEPRAHTDWYWLLVEASGYETTATPLSREPTPLNSLSEHQRLDLGFELSRPR